MAERLKKIDLESARQRGRRFRRTYLAEVEN